MCQLRPSWPPPAINLYITCYSDCTHVQTSEDFSLKIRSRSLSKRFASIVARLPLLWPHPLPWSCRFVWSWPCHWAASASGLSWSMVNFHWHRAWRSTRKSIIYGHGSCNVAPLISSGGVFTRVVWPLVQSIHQRRAYQGSYYLQHIRWIGQSVLLCSVQHLQVAEGSYRLQLIMWTGREVLRYRCSYNQDFACTQTLQQLQLMLLLFLYDRQRMGICLTL